VSASRKVRRAAAQVQVERQLPLVQGHVVPGGVHRPHQGVEVEAGARGLARVAPHGLQDLLQALGDGAQGLPHLVQHVALLRR